MIIKVNIKSVSITPDDITDTLQTKPSRCIGNLNLRRVNEVMKEFTFALQLSCMIEILLL